MQRLNLGELIDLLKTRPKDEPVCFDFGRLVPGECISYRGYYEDLAIEFKECEEYPEPTVATFLKHLRAAIGKEFEGYKGGQYKMTRKSRVWVANYSHTSDTAIVGIEDYEGATILRTAWME